MVPITPALPPSRVRQEMPQRGERRVTLRMPGFAPIVRLSFHAPPVSHAEDPTISPLGMPAPMIPQAPAPMAAAPMAAAHNPNARTMLGMAPPVMPHAAAMGQPHAPPQMPLAPPPMAAEPAPGYGGQAFPAGSQPPDAGTTAYCT